MYHSWSFSDIFLSGLAIFFIVFWIGYWHVHLISIFYGKWRLHRRSETQKLLNSQCVRRYRAIHQSSDSSQQQTIIDVTSYSEKPSPEISIGIDSLPGVSVLKPLLGVDYYLKKNLESFFCMTYPKFELLFCVAGTDDPAIGVVQGLIDQYPLVDAQLFIGGEIVGVNPKVNNMMPAYRAAKYDLILVSDSGIMMRHDTLLDMVFTMLKPDLQLDGTNHRLYKWYSWLRNRGTSKGIGLVHQMPFSVDRDEFGFPACLEKVYFGTAHARIYLAADWAGINCPTGMSALMRKNLLENRGGMAAFGKYLAEDYFFAKAFTDQNWSICISSQPAWQNSGVCHLAAFQGRLQRWAKLRFAMIPFTSAVESLQECVTLGVFASLSLQFLLGLSALGVFFAHAITWFLLDWTLLKTVQNEQLSFSKMNIIISWVFRETTCLGMFLKAVLDQKIEWRNGYYKLHWGGKAELIQYRPKNERRLLNPTVSFGSDERLCKIGDFLPSSHPPEESVPNSLIPATSDSSFLIESMDLSLPKLVVRKNHLRTRSLPPTIWASIFKSVVHKFDEVKPFNIFDRYSRFHQSNEIVLK